MVPIRPSTLCLLSLFLLSAVGITLGNQLSETEIADFLQTLARKSPQGFAAKFEETRHLPLFAQPITESGFLEFITPNFLRKEITSPQPSLTLLDGKTLWILYPNNREGEAYPLHRSRQLRDTFNSITACLDPLQIPKIFHTQAHRTPDNSTTLTLIPKNSKLRSAFTQLTLQFSPDLNLKTLSLQAHDGANSTLRFFQHSRPSFSAPKFLPPNDYQISFPMGQ